MDGDTKQILMEIGTKKSCLSIKRLKELVLDLNRYTQQLCCDWELH